MPQCETDINALKNGWVARWIPVTERLPKVGKKVLITDRYGKIQIGRTHLSGRGYEPYWEYLEESGTDYWSKVTALAWMPLPDPYEVEE